MAVTLIEDHFLVNYYVPMRIRWILKSESVET